MVKAFMGVSIKNPFYFNKENILKAISLAKDFDEFLIFTVDKPYSLSLQAFNEITSEKAEKIALKEGEELRNFLIKIAKKFKNVKVLSLEELETEDYKKFLIEIERLEEQDNTFSNLIKNEFTGTILSKIKGNQYKEKLCKEFIIKEVAMFVFLFNKGYTIRISKYLRSKSVDYFLKDKNKLLEHLTII